ncbi:MAG: spheroidene monooxygenase [Betaproteobacteria bacterium]
MARTSLPPGADLGGRLQRDADDAAAPGAVLAPGRPGTRPGPAAGLGRVARPDPGLAVLLLVRLRASQVPWAVGQLVRGPGRWLREPGVRFARVLGSGRDGGFGLRPGLDHQGVFLMFDEVADALALVARSPLVAAYRSRAERCLVAVLQASSARGHWAGQGMRAIVPPPCAGQPVLALTRASIRPSRAWRFWRHSPPSEAALAAAPGCRLAVGLGEAPVLRQATLSLWDDTAAMNAYARQGAHQRAIESSYGEGYFSESMFVRFVPLLMQGHWGANCIGAGSDRAGGGHG